ncbi:MAG: hypothetical protein II433_00475 [Acidaminococcaceae bacterium]|nr:hypothetical protein [Acidaminococcaceae bacterium]
MRQGKTPENSDGTAESAHASPKNGQERGASRAALSRRGKTSPALKTEKRNETKGERSALQSLSRLTARPFCVNCGRVSQSKHAREQSALLLKKDGAVALYRRIKQSERFFFLLFVQCFGSRAEYGQERPPRRQQEHVFGRQSRVQFISNKAYIAIRIFYGRINVFAVNKINNLNTFLV